MITRRIRAAATVFMLVSAACTSDILFESSGSSGTGSSGSGASGSTSGSGGNDSCAAFDDQTGDAVTLRIHNQSDLPIYLPTLCGNVTTGIEPITGPDGIDYNFDQFCLATCQMLHEQGQFVCAADACALMAQYVAPGGSVEVSWSGTGLETTDMPLACFKDPATDTSCQQIVTAPDNRYRVEIQGFSSCGPECACEPNGQCFGEATGIEAYHDPVTIDHPNQGVVDVVFGPCAFGCAEPT